MQVLNHKDFCHFKYEGPEANENFKLGQVVFKESELQNEGNPIGVVIQVFEDGDCRTDMYGNVSSNEVRQATLEDVEEYRPDISTQCVDLDRMLSELDLEAVRTDDTDAVLVRDKTTGWQAWIDVWVDDNDVHTDWNQYIFMLDNNDHLRARLIQRSAEIFSEFSDYAIHALEDSKRLVQKEDGTWTFTKK